MNKIYSISNLEQVEKEKAEAKRIIEESFSKIKEMGIQVNIARQGHLTLNPVDFDYWHKDERFKLDYKVTN